MNIKNILALGAGAMGSQVSFYYAMRGFDVIQFDISEEALAACKQYHHGYVEPFKAVNPAFTAKDSAAGLARISYTTDLEAAAKNADLVTESVPEVLAIKQKIYTELNQYCPVHTIFTTNTSTMRPSSFRPRCRWATAECEISEPVLEQVDDRQMVACFESKAVSDSVETVLR